jgi:RND family efflux transporter MFP subunit
MNRSVNNQSAKRGGGFKILLTLVVIILIIGVALFVGSRIIKSAPVAQRHAPVVQAPLVDIQPLQTTSEQVVVTAMGTVVPAREVVLKSEVSGRVTAISKHLELGSKVNVNEELISVEPTDYRLAVAQAESMVAEAKYDLDIEMGNQDIAQQEWDMYDNRDGASQQDKDLALRKPHLIKAQAEYKSAQAQLEQAELNLERTAISAPFNATVIAKEVEIGSMLSAQGTVATLVATDSYWAQVSIPVDRLSWIDIPDGNSSKGATVKIVAGDKQKTGQVHKLLADIEESGRMARLMVEITDPLDLKKPADQRQPLLLGEFVRVEIEGTKLDDVLSVPSSTLHNGNQIWLLDGEDKLEIATAEVIWRDTDRVLIKDTFAAGAKLIISNLATPVAGMQLRSESLKTQTPSAPEMMPGSASGAEDSMPAADRQGPSQESGHE